MLDQEIERVCTRLKQRVTDSDVACQAVKQLVRSHFGVRVSGIELEVFNRLADALFRRFGLHETEMLASELVMTVQRMRARCPEPNVVWIEA
ncbi:hypothetical protein [Asticcacaulis solisilvae]|uniref:hypothetical protein n=1 Tax=Asticcacaulis solisilvae TaxID=1217274 RepID=UPI003FD79D60